MDPADIRAVIAILLRGQELGRISKMVANGSVVSIYTTKVITDDYYLGRAQQILESSWTNYKHPAGEDSSQQGVSEAIALLTSKGYSISLPGPSPAP